MQGNTIKTFKKHSERLSRLSRQVPGHPSPFKTSDLQELAYCSRICYRQRLEHLPNLTLSLVLLSAASFLTKRWLEVLLLCSLWQHRLDESKYFDIFQRFRADPYCPHHFTASTDHTSPTAAGRYSRGSFAYGAAAHQDTSSTLYRSTFNIGSPVPNASSYPMNPSETASTAHVSTAMLNKASFRQVYTFRYAHE